jgi:hypothetical protein
MRQDFERLFKAGGGPAAGSDGVAAVLEVGGSDGRGDGRAGGP